MSHVATGSLVSRHGSSAVVGSWVATGNVVSRQWREWPCVATGWTVCRANSGSRHGFCVAIVGTSVRTEVCRYRAFFVATEAAQLGCDTGFWCSDRR